MEENKTNKEITNKAKVPDKNSNTKINKIEIDKGDKNKDIRKLDSTTSIKNDISKIKDNRLALTLGVFCIVGIICIIALGVSNHGYQSRYDDLYYDYDELKSNFEELSNMEKYKDVPTELLDEALAKYEEQLAKEEAEKQKQYEEQLAKEEAEKQKQAEEKAKAEAKQYDTGITYEQLARNPDKYTGSKAKFKGKVIQVIEDGSGEIQIRLAVNNNYDTVLYCTYPDSITSSRVLENDTITVYGMSLGTITYQSTIGGNITIPAMDVEKIEM